MDFIMLSFGDRELKIQQNYLTAANIAMIFRLYY